MVELELIIPLYLVLDMVLVDGLVVVVVVV